MKLLVVVVVEESVEVDVDVDVDEDDVLFDEPDSMFASRKEAGEGERAAQRNRGGCRHIYLWHG